MNLKLNVFEETKPEHFVNYFTHFKIPGITESYDLDQLLSLMAGDEHIDKDPSAAVLPYLLDTFFFVHDELLEERVLNVTMRVFNQRDEMRSNLRNLQVLFDDEKTKLYEYLDHKMIRLTELIERSEIWLSEFNRKVGDVPPEMIECEAIIQNFVLGFNFDIVFEGDRIARRESIHTITKFR